ncbi:Shugoshin [Pyrenophora tritici-repentis]|uniref:Shugoshin n=1 Tax=Pyrenophora tritici-repentis (strain Pt-1C-BFP) TaxID=426418 RepID=B2W1L6_PYRTR|nr:shugoshin [Pyrenophora tritici-repentis Pt-1C-BFP]EDU47189.1 shugoshin [Pyrenophora tritici-repentis Pt-1C-BFP]KAI1669803.1 Shugoshin [Pyrenophora tritici-repentis]KAI1681389.1 Shugoshin [Pyrenophora tritici-repentis]
MARLNEPPIAPQPSAETIEAVKRRFLRQNRELAKTNSTQSIRIRSLENDCSRLLAENLALREQVLSLHNKIESRPGLDHIDAVRTQLEAKLQELGGLVAGLAQMKNGSQQDKGRRKSQMTAQRKSGEERQWRSGLGLQEVENAMLPTITEDKFYPRRTMGADELDQVLEGPEGHSPDIGPPPVSRFESEDPIGFDPSPAAQEPQEETGEDGEPSLSVNLETRKKRRESGPKLSIRRVSLFEPPEETEEAVAKPIRTGAKRKFSVQEDEDVNQSKSDAFRFSRRNAPSASETQASNEESRPTSPHRPVLSSKPVNTDPVLSPKKQRSSLQAKPEKPEKPAPKSRSRPRLNITRNAAPELAPPPMPEPIPTADIVLDSLPPKTPAVEAVFSPPSTEPSTQRPDNKDTPPPGDLTSSDQTGQAGRPGRRARPQVSYKEPSLNVKMRRPDAKLVDAVIDRRTSVDTQNPPSTAVKRDPNGEIAWKPVSAVSGRGGEEEVEVGSPLRQKLDRRDQDSKTSPPSDETEERSTTSRSISALVTETGTAKRRVTTSTKPTLELGATSQDLPLLSKDSIVVQQEAPKDNLAIFDFTDSPVDTATNPRNRALEAAKAARTARRHSAMSIPNASSSVSEERKVEREKAEGALPSLHKRTGSGNVKSTSTTSFGKSTSANGTTRSTSSARTASVKDRRHPSGEELPASASTDLRAKVDGAEETKARERETIAMRAERAASRRKSMLL